MLYQASIQYSHVAVCNISFNFKLAAVAPECLLVLGTIKLLYLRLFKCSSGFLHLGDERWNKRRKPRRYVLHKKVCFIPAWRFTYFLGHFGGCCFRCGWITLGQLKGSCTIFSTFYLKSYFEVVCKFSLIGLRANVNKNRQSLSL